MRINNSGFLSSIPTVTLNLIIINILFLFADTVFSQIGINLSGYLGLHYITSEQFMPHQIITYMFMHGSFTHLFFNMFAIFMFGRILETVLGAKKFLKYYILCGIGAAIIQMLVYFIRIKALESSISPDLLSEMYKAIHEQGVGILLSGQNYKDAALGALNGLINTPTVGASGAVFGILVAFGMLFPNVELMMIPIPIPIKAKWFIIGYVVLELILGISDNPNDNVAHFAHLGGLLTGFLIMLYWRKKTTTNGDYHQ